MHQFKFVRSESIQYEQCNLRTVFFSSPTFFIPKAIQPTIRQRMKHKLIKEGLGNGLTDHF